MVKARSPRYPGISLETAIDYAKKLYRAINRQSSARPPILGHLGYSPKSSSGIIVFAALKQFGLLDAKHGGTAKLSKLAIAIVIDDRIDSTERRAAIEQSALMPPFYKELWEKYEGQLPADADIKYFLISDKHFTPKGSDDFIEQFRATVEYANLSPLSTNNEALSEAASEKSGNGESVALRVSNLLKPPLARDRTGNMDQATFPLDEGTAVLQWPADLSLASVEEFEDWLELVKKSVRRASTARSRQPDTEYAGSSGD